MSFSSDSPLRYTQYPGFCLPTFAPPPRAHLNLNLLSPFAAVDASGSRPASAPRAVDIDGAAGGRTPEATRYDATDDGASNPLTTAAAEAAVLEAMEEADAYAAAEAAAAAAAAASAATSDVPEAVGEGGGGVSPDSIPWTGARPVEGQPQRASAVGGEASASAPIPSTGGWQRDNVVFGGGGGAHGYSPVRSLLDASFVSVQSSLASPLPPPQQQSGRGNASNHGFCNGKNEDGAAPTSVAAPTGSGSARGQLASIDQVGMALLADAANDVLDTEALLQLRANYVLELEQMSAAATAAAATDAQQRQQEGQKQRPRDTPLNNAAPAAPRMTRVRTAPSGGCPPKEHFPADTAGLLRLREDYAMELLWAKQAVASRQEYLKIRNEFNGSE